MRRTLFGLLVLFATLGLFLVTGCQRENSLRITAVEPENVTYGDITDFMTWTDPTEEQPTPEIFGMVMSDNVQISLQYVEMGLGLPTWTPYQAHIEAIQLTYTDMSNTPPEIFDPATVLIQTEMIVPADPKATKTSKITIPIASAEWKSANLEEAGDPTETDGAISVACHIKVTGTDDLSGKAIQAEADVTINFGNYWDDPSRLGQ